MRNVSRNAGCFKPNAEHRIDILTLENAVLPGVLPRMREKLDGAHAPAAAPVFMHATDLEPQLLTPQHALGSARMHAASDHAASVLARSRRRASKTKSRSTRSREKSDAPVSCENVMDITESCMAK